MCRCVADRMSRRKPRRRWGEPCANGWKAQANYNSRSELTPVIFVTNGTGQTTGSTREFLRLLLAGLQTMIQKLVLPMRGLALGTNDSLVERRAESTRRSHRRSPCAGRSFRPGNALRGKRRLTFSGPAISTVPLMGVPSATSVTAAATSSDAMGCTGAGDK